MNRSLRLVFFFSCILPLATTTIATTAEGSAVSSSDNTNNTLDRNPPTMSEVRDTPITNNHGGINK